MYKYVNLSWICFFRNLTKMGECLHNNNNNNSTLNGERLSTMNFQDINQVNKNYVSIVSFQRPYSFFTDP